MSSSANCRDVLVAAGIEDLFEARIDGIVAEREHLRGKPAPDTFLAGARALGLEAGEAAVFEDALAGVEAGRAGHFGFVVGVDRVGQAEALKAARRRHRGDRPRRAAGPLMINQPTVQRRAVGLRETKLDLDMLAQTESVFALSNGHIGWRGNLDEGEPHGLPGTYLNGVYELRPLPYAEAVYGCPESGQTIINVTNGKLIRLFVDDEPFDVRYGELRSHERAARLPRRAAEPPRRVGVAGRRGGPGLVDPAGVVHPAGDRGDLLRGGAAGRTRRGSRVQSELLANEQLPPVRRRSRGSAPRWTTRWTEEYGRRERARPSLLVHRTKRQRAAGRRRRWTTRSSAARRAGRVPGVPRRRP